MRTRGVVLPGAWGGCYRSRPTTRQEFKRLGDRQVARRNYELEPAWNDREPSGAPVSSAQTRGDQALDVILLGRVMATPRPIVDYLSKHPGSTAGDVAKALNLKRNSTSTRLAQMAKSGELKKAASGDKAA